MSESESDTSATSPVSPVSPVSPEGAPGAGKPARRVLSGRWIGGRRARWVTAGAAVVLVGGSALGVAAAVHEHEDHGDVRRSARGLGDEGPLGGIRADRHLGGKPEIIGEGPVQGPGQGREQGRAVGRAKGAEENGPGNRAAGRPAGEGRGNGLAPAPLPAVTAVQAAEKAAAAVADGRVESLSTVAQQGGGTGWQAVVLGPDGVRHRVTVDGASGQITGNTVEDGRTAR
ncbi:hypothetical protein [Kitasatospora sp. NPDC057223]|uniref:hypothetical protein n=1 Tax=Kitasatospora sp. NPDC057223 TaxID=3346055 RepID=UPI00363975A3